MTTPDITTTDNTITYGDAKTVWADAGRNSAAYLDGQMPEPMPEPPCPDKEPAKKKMAAKKVAAIRPHPFKRHTKEEMLKASADSGAVKTHWGDADRFVLYQDDYLGPKKGPFDPKKFLIPACPGFSGWHPVCNELAIIEGFHEEPIIQLRGYAIMFNGVSIMDRVPQSCSPFADGTQDGYGMLHMASKFPRAGITPCGWETTPQSEEKRNKALKVLEEAVAPYVLYRSGRDKLRGVMNKDTNCIEISQSAERQLLKSMFGDPLGILNCAAEGYPSVTQVTVMPWQHLAHLQWVDTRGGIMLEVGVGLSPQTEKAIVFAQNDAGNDASSALEDALRDDGQVMRKMNQANKALSACWAIDNKITPTEIFPVEGILI